MHFWSLILSVFKCNSFTSDALGHRNKLMRAKQLILGNTFARAVSGSYHALIAFINSDEQEELLQISRISPFKSCLKLCNDFHH